MNDVIVDNELDVPLRSNALLRRFRGEYEVDPWGLDTDLLELVSPLWSLRFGIDLAGGEHLPSDGPALVVANRRAGLSEPFVLSRGVRIATGRHLRCVGVPDLAPLGPALRRLGGVLARPDEVAGLLRDGQVVGVLLDRDLRHRAHAGAVPAALFAPAFELGVPVVPVALVGRELGRSWRALMGPPVRHPEGRGPLAMAALADRARAGVQQLLDDALPPRGWL